MAESARIVVVVGAGASRELGSKGPVPLMGDWASELINRLDEREPDLAKAVGLVEGAKAEEFEEALGAFMQWHRVAMPLTERFRGIGGPRPGSWTDQVPKWIEKSKTRALDVVEALRESMYENFGRQAIDGKKAEDAYGRLISVFGPGSRLVFATTNYDPAIEIGSERVGLDPNDGFRRRSHWDTATLDPSRLVDWRSGDRAETPVLHLHGAVGWYQRDDGEIAQQPPDQPYNPTLGTPVFLPPDPAKDPSNDATVSSIWEQFRVALTGATHLLVIGHSLNDEPLVETIRSEGPQASIGVFSPEADTVATRLEDARPIKGSFGPSVGVAGIQKWFDGIVELSGHTSM